MARKKAASKQSAAPTEARPGSPHRVAVLLLCAATLAFYWAPLFQSQASIQWDAVDVHYSSQKYFADHIREGRLPHWTPYVFSGFPFLSDPQVGAWYPLNWPFFVVGITPRAVQAEVALHALLAALGMYLFAWRKLGHRAAALGAAAAYAFSGYFTGHASHVGIFQTAAWLGWILLALDRAITERSASWTLGAGLLTGVMNLAGHFQTALYIGFAAACYATWLVAEDGERWKRAVAALGSAAVLGAGVSAVMAIPGIDLLSHSVRSGVDFGNATNSPLLPASLGTLIHPNLYGIFSEAYSGPQDITQYYFYAGVLLVPLAVLGSLDPKVRWAALALAAPAAWYAFGPAGGLYLALAKLPGLSSVRAPVHIWFVVAFGLALLGGCGILQAARRWRLPWLPFALPAVLFCDLLWFNSATNPLAYARTSYRELYGNGLEQFQTRVGGQLPALMRLHGAYALAAFGPQNHLLDARVEGTYGYNPLRLRNYNAYMASAESDPAKLAALGAKFRLNPAVQGVEASDDVLPRVTIAGRPPQAVGLPPLAQPKVLEYGEGSYRVAYKLEAPAVVRVAEVYYPGWTAESAGRALEVGEVDGVFIGVTVPAGEGEFTLRFRTRRFGVAAGISLVSALAAAALMIRFRKATYSHP